MFTVLSNSNKASDVIFHITNTGNVDLKNVAINSSAPSGWTVTCSNLEKNIISSILEGTTTELAGGRGGLLSDQTFRWTGSTCRDEDDRQASERESP